MIETPDEFLTLEQAAQRLQICQKTLRSYIKAGLIESLCLNPHLKRSKRLISIHALAAYIDANSRTLKTPARPKRAYNRTVKKYARRKPGKKRKAA